MKKLCALLCLISFSLIAMSSAFAFEKVKMVNVINDTNLDISYDYEICNSEMNWCPGSGSDVLRNNKKLRKINIKLQQSGKHPFLKIKEVRQIDSDGYPTGGFAKFKDNRCKAHAKQSLILELNSAKQIICRTTG